MSGDKIDVMVIGSGGREHAICWKLVQSPKLGKLYCAPGNGGTATLERTVNVDLKVSDFAGIAKFAKENSVGLIVIGPDNPLADGIVDYLQSQGLRVFGPTQQGAMLESSKAFAKEFMVKHKLPTARFLVAEDHQTALSLLKANPWIRVVKADGLALGKGVFVCDNDAEVEAALEIMFGERRFGDAAKQVVLEERLQGEEISLLFFCDGTHITAMPACQDHKRRFDGDRGPNTGGMGVYSPVPLYMNCATEIENEVIKPLRQVFADKAFDFKGVIYAGLLVVCEQNPDGSVAYKPNVLEFNARFGDPETQVIMPLLRSDLLQILWNCTDGTLSSTPVQWSTEAACCVVACADSYPESSSSGKAIVIGTSNNQSVSVFHAGTKLSDGKLVTAGGRVLAVTALAGTSEESVALAYESILKIKFEGMDYRKDIGRRKLAACR
ncbi:MAG: phosphoribosylamine--glycine ligase [Candidatus Obscuribacterales bacterium]|nr:phosphoribosylamine--glycine ligase [Candidatus Obscuribacterales bacterium]